MWDSSARVSAGWHDSELCTCIWCKSFSGRFRMLQIVRSPLYLISPKQESSWRAAVKFTRNTTHYIFHYKLTTTHYKLTTNSLHALQTHYKSTTNPLQSTTNPLQSTTFITNLLQPLLITNSSMACFECVECHGMATAQPMHQEFSSLL